MGLDLETFGHRGLGVALAADDSSAASVYGKRAVVRVATL